jgi:hypothetical protein
MNEESNIPPGEWLMALLPLVCGLGIGFMVGVIVGIGLA